MAARDTVHLAPVLLGFQAKCSSNYDTKTIKKALEALEAKNNRTADEDLKIDEYRHYLQKHSGAHEVGKGLEILGGLILDYEGSR